MKIYSIALSSIVLLAGIGTHSNAFVPRTSTSSQRTFQMTHHTKSRLFTATVSGAAQVGADLGLEYTPIVPFGKNAPADAASLGGDAKKVLGGKGANLNEMSQLGLSVPPGFTITTECCDRYCNEWNNGLPEALWQEIVGSIEGIEDEMQSQFGSPENPLLLSVRSGAAISMPGMVSSMSTVSIAHRVYCTEC